MSIVKAVLNLCVMLALIYGVYLIYLISYNGGNPFQ